MNSSYKAGWLATRLRTSLALIIAMPTFNWHSFIRIFIGKKLGIVPFRMAPISRKFSEIYIKRLTQAIIKA